MNPASGAPRPFFASPVAPTATRRMLLVSYFFTPINVIGSIRWHRMCQFAAERGWAIDVVMVDPASGGSIDAASTMAIDLEKLDELPPGVAIYQVPDRRSWWSRAQRVVWRAIRPIVRQRASSATPVTAERPTVANGGPSREVTRARAAYLARLQYRDFIQWARAASRTASRIARANRPDVIVSAGPPHSAQEAARRVARRSNIPWVMDMRDPWVANESTPSDVAGPTWSRLTAAAEARCVSAASLVVLNTEAARREIAARYPSLAGRFTTVMNGADPIEIPAGVTPGRRFTLAYAGNIYVGRDPTTLFQAVARVVRELGLSPAEIGLEFMGGGEYARSAVLAAAAAAGITAFVTIVPRQPHREALAFLARAPMLVGLPQHADLAIPAKLFEYVQFDAWLLVLADANSATEVLLRGTRADVVRPTDVDGIAERVKCRYQQYCRGERPVAVNADGSFDRRRQAELLFDAIQRLL